MVPISLEALLVNKDGNAQTFADRTYNYQSLENGEVLGDSMMKDFFAEDKTIEKGLHLHWALPDALTQGFQTNTVENDAFKDISGLDLENSNKIYMQLQKNRFIDGSGKITRRLNPGQDGFTLGLSQELTQYEPEVISVLQALANQGDVKYPSVPVCWYVLRIVTDDTDIQNPKTTLKAWVVESTHFNDAYVEGEDRITIPAQNVSDDTFYCKFLGRQTEYEAWTMDKPECYIDELTAVGPGDPMFSAYYPSCKSVFGFYDPLDDIKSGQLTYMVMGWYPNTDLDPLYGDVSSDLWLSCLNQLGWSANGENTDQPKEILCHGMIYNVAWAGDNGNYKSNIPTEDPKIVWGNNSVEAISTLIASKLSGEPQDVAKIIEALNYELLKEFDLPDGIAKLEEKIHEKTFDSSKGGIEFSIDYPSFNDSNDFPDVIADFPDTIGSDLKQINFCQRQLEAVQNHLAAWQWEAYSTWYKYICARSAPQANEEVKADTKSMVKDGIDYEKIIDELAVKINSLKSQQADLKSKVSSFIEKINGEIALSLPGYTFGTINRNRFWQVTDPVLLFSGEGVSRSFRYGYDGQYSEDGSLGCRITDSTVTGISVKANEKMVTVTADEILQFCSGIPCDKTPVPSELKSLFIESMLLDTSQSKLIAVAALKLAGEKEPSIQDINTLSEEIEKIQTLAWNACFTKNVTAQKLAEAAGLVGTIPEKISITPWAQAWVPLYMEWFVNLFDFDDIKPDFSNVLSHWELGDIDYHCLAKAPGNTTHQFRGSVLITPHAPYNMQSALQNYIDKLEPDYSGLQELKDICAQLGNLDILSQSMTGFHNAMTMRKETLQFPVFDIPKNYGGNPEFAKKVADLVDDMNIVSPMPEGSFHPICAGFMKPIKLWIVDAFGQVKDLNLSNAELISEEYTTDGDAFNQYVTLKPALAQPARLNFDWISADGNCITNSDPASNPICGWLLPSHLENSLMIFDQQGNELGGLVLFYESDKSTRVYWESAPGTSIEPDDITNVELKGFVKGLLNFNASTGDTLIELLQNIDETLGSVDPLGFQDDQSLAVLTGRPLALVNATINLEIQGLPAFSQSWKDLGKYNTYGFEKVEFPARLGDISQICDGLMGYFVKNGGDTYNTFHVTPGVKEKSISSGYVVYDHSIKLNAVPDGAPVSLTFILDPRAGIHVTTGILPVMYKEISPDYVSGVLDNMSVTFSVNPIMNTLSQIGMPIPAIDSLHQWSWVYHLDKNTWSETAEILTVSQNAAFQPEGEEVSEGWLKLTRKGKK